jgi:Cu(I)/Ag(I) efflux system membrane fusion protein
MSENTSRPPNVSRGGDTSANIDVLSEGGLRAPAHLGTLGKVWWWFDFLILVKLARLRFIAILGVIAVGILYWDTLVAYYEKWSRPVLGDEHAAGPNVEYFCPMHPQVVTDNPREKCPICFMNLSPRKKGAGAPAEALPPGTVTRLQLSPYKVVTAGIRTWDVNYEPLSKRVETFGTVTFDENGLSRISARVRMRIDRLYVRETGATIRKGDPLADVYSEDIVSTVQNLLDAPREGDRELARDRLHKWGIDDDQIREFERAGKPITHVTLRSPVHGHVTRKYAVEGEYVAESAPLYDVADLATVWVEAQVYENELSFLKEGLPVKATTEALPNRVFAGKVAFVYPHLEQASRTLRVRFTIENPDHQKRPEASLRPGVYARVAIDVPAEQLPQHYASRAGRVAAVPEEAVVYTGGQKIVFRQEAPSVFDAVAVELGPLLSGPGGSRFYPVVKGLEAGQRVVTTGSFLLDAETRVSPAAGSIYSGGTGGGSRPDSPGPLAVRPSTQEDEEANARVNLAKLSTPDRRLAEAQKVCPVRGTRLGSMGRPVEVVLDGEPVFLCCTGCEEEAKADPVKTLAAVEGLKKRKSAPPAAVAGKEAMIRANLAKLGDEDRKLAEAQKYCPIQPDTRLGLMGKPVKLMLQGRPVFLCCPGCVEEAEAHPDKTLAALEQVKAKALPREGGR